MNNESNLYLTMPLDRVRRDAMQGVTLARIAWRRRDPEAAALGLGRTAEPGDERAGRILRAAGDYQRQRGRQGKMTENGRK